EDGNPVAGEKEITFKGMPTLAKEEDAPNDASELDEASSPSTSGISRAAKPKPGSGSGGAASSPSAE
ncbi:MAG TPA: hypothetical protein PLT55_05015, partial [Acidimicrobiia bacterium]|nr:hypothetical protein [Acidimicrobiia bacterium]